MKRFFSLLLVSLSIILFSITGCTTKKPAGSSKSIAVNVGTWKTAQTIQPFTYDKYLSKDYDLKVLPFTNPGDQKAALVAGKLNYTGTTLVNAIIAASKGEPVVIVNSLCNKCSALVVGKDLGINTPKDLKGKKIAYVPGTMHHILLLEVLENAGLNPQKDVELIRIDFFDMGQALAKGEIDAFCSGEPFPALAVKEGYGKILSYPYFDESIGTINAAMITTKDEIEKNREIIQELVIAHAKATKYLNLHQEEWLDMAADFGTEHLVLEKAANNIELSWDIDQEFIKKTEKLAIRMKELGVISEVPDMQKLFDLSFLEQVRKDLQK